MPVIRGADPAVVVEGRVVVGGGVRVSVVTIVSRSRSGGADRS
jgi:hypothetical protein